MPAEPWVLFVNQHYWPDVASTGQHLTDLAEHLSGTGFRVSVLCSRGDYRGGALRAPAREVRNGVRIRRLGVPGFGRGRLAGRAADYAAFHAGAALRAALEPRPHLVVSLTTPSLLPATVRAACALRGVPYGIWAMDLHPEVEDRLGLLPGGRAVSAPLHAASRAGYAGAGFVVTLGPHMARRIEGKGVPRGRIREIPVWNRGSVIRPLARRENPLRRELGYGEDDLVVLYSGNAGLAHRFEEVLGAAHLLRDRSDVHFLFVGGGPRRPEVERRATRLELPRFRYVDYFDREDLGRSLSTGDVHLLTLRPDMAGLVAPSKLYGSMAAGRPVVMVGPQASDPAHVITRERVGAVIRHGPKAAERLAERLRAYADDPVLRARQGARARAVFLKRYEKSVCCDEWTTLLSEMMAHGVPKGRNAVERADPGSYVPHESTERRVPTSER